MENGQEVSQGGYNFGDGVFKSNKILWEGGIDPILRGLWNTAVKRPHRMTPAITERMFGTTDLGTLNIMRGREHGIPSYNKWRKFCGLTIAKTFDDLKTEILDNHIRSVLAKNYPSPGKIYIFWKFLSKKKITDEVDFYVAAMVEDPVQGGLIGVTLSCVIGEQL